MSKISRKELLMGWRNRWSDSLEKIGQSSSSRSVGLTIDASSFLAWVLLAPLFDGDELGSVESWNVRELLKKGQEQERSELSASFSASLLDDLGHDRLGAAAVPMVEGISSWGNGRKDLLLFGCYTSAIEPDLQDPGFFTTKAWIAAHHHSFLRLIEQLAGVSSWVCRHPAPAAQFAFERTGKPIPEIEEELLTRPRSFLPAASLMYQLRETMNSPDQGRPGLSLVLPADWEQLIYDGSLNETNDASDQANE